MEVAAVHSFPAIGELDVLLQPSICNKRIRRSLSKLSGDETLCPEQLQTEKTYDTKFRL